MDNSRKLGRVLMLSILTGTQNLMDNVTTGAEREEETHNTIFSKLTDSQLYSRLLTDINFSKLSKDEQNKFLLLKPEIAESVDKQNLYANEMREFVQEAHNRTCKSLGVKPTNVIVCNFSENPLMDPWAYSSYDATNGNIYINSEVDYSTVRPTFLLESINARTYQHGTYSNISKVVKQPESLTDVEFFLTLTTAVKNHVYQENANPEDLGNFLIADDGYTPSSLAAQIYAFEKTRLDLQSAGIYGLQAREQLREAEEDFHKDLQTYIGNDSLLNSEDMFAYFKGSNLNASSNGLLGKLLDSIDASYSSVFYNSVGASMQSGSTVKQYLDHLEGQMFEEEGLTPPTDEEMQELIELEKAEREMIAEQEELGISQSDDEPNDEEDTEDEENPRREGDGEPISYKPFDSVLPPEGKIDLIKVLPFHQVQIEQNEGIPQN